MELLTDLAFISDLSGPGDYSAVAGAAEVGSDLLGPLEGRITRPRPPNRIVRRGSRKPYLVDAGQDVSHFGKKAVKRLKLVDRSGERALGARSVVTGDVDHQCVVELAHFIKSVDQSPNLVIGVGEEISVVLRETGVEPFLIIASVVPCRDLI